MGVASLLPASGEKGVPLPGRAYRCHCERSEANQEPQGSAAEAWIASLRSQ
jgi:hypothetical protein